MSALEDLADQLARDALDAAVRLGDDRLIEEISKAVGASSPVAQEAFVSAVRIRQALARGRAVMDSRMSQATGRKAGPEKGGA
ncbi:hypothetical protein [Rhodovulum sp. MB263]|uniref:hypothetical protein n=1 Tax=unclassified Rhodovulum TaxID=2631432 RepID=UPI0009B75F88|nr:hypothetical protein [Rhodovulum sp. MB263]ARC88494.1 hypothetical protein B5V46_07630 [Rhodovulum sp. MB263]